MNFSEKRILGKTGLQVGRLGLASSYGAPARAFEEAFEKGCNYFVWNSFIRGRSPRMREAIRNIVKKGQRDKLVIAMHSYGHNAFINRYYFMKSLKALGVDYIDVMLLGYHPRKPGKGEMEGALKLKEKGLTRFIGLTGHNRKLFPTLDAEGILDVFHIRYNAVNCGAETDVFPHLKKEKGLTRFIGLTGHNRKLFPVLDAEDILDVFHIRYNAVNSGAETDVFPHLRKDGRAGIVAFTATRWGQLLNPKKMPEGETPPSAADCYRYVLSHPDVDICMTGPKTLEQMRENLSLLDLGSMNEEDLARMRRIGDHIYGKKRSAG